MLTLKVVYKSIGSFIQFISHQGIKLNNKRVKNVNQVEN